MSDTKERLLYLLLLLLFREVHSQNSTGGGDITAQERMVCTSQTRCRDCITAASYCNWCADIDFDGPRCHVIGESLHPCSENGTQNPTGGIMQVDMSPLEGLKQVSPGNVNVTLRRDEPVSVPVTVKPARNYPLDIYMLMDLSYSMADDLETIKTLGTEIANSITEVTSNFRLGFGSFVDKKLAPYTALDELSLTDPCAPPYGPGGCLPPYSFKHAITLTDNSTEFDVANSEVCGNGTLLCGTCECNEGRFGRFCQCDNTGQVTGESNSTQANICPNGPNEQMCTGRGLCVCGQCECSTYLDERTGEVYSYTGPACECDNQNCDISNGEYCGGSLQGECLCDGCKCREGYYGKACQCSDNFCIDPDDKEGRICNGRGECDCNTCSDCESPFTGRHCEICQAPSGVSPEDNPCASTLCTPNIACARCALGLIANDSAECVDCPPYTLINGTDMMDYVVNGVPATLCRFVDDCTYTFWVHQNREGEEQLFVEQDPVCPEPISSSVIAAIIIVPLVVLVIIGLLLLLLLLIIMGIINHIEVKKFEKELAKSKYTKNDNPLYVQANKEYQNPAYGK